MLGVEVGLDHMRRRAWRRQWSSSYNVSGGWVSMA